MPLKKKGAPEKLKVITLDKWKKMIDDSINLNPFTTEKNNPKDVKISKEKGKKNKKQ